LAKRGVRLRNPDVKLQVFHVLEHRHSAILIEIAGTGGEGGTPPWAMIAEGLGQLLNWAMIGDIRVKSIGDALNFVRSLTPASR
jgi:hypothetical protein